MSILFDSIVERAKHFPAEPGCYLMKDRRGKIFYIGKAINLKTRVRSYFSGQDNRPFVAWLEDILADIEIIVVRNNTEALLLEQTLIQTHKPRFNILLKDDKKFILLRLNTKKAPADAQKHARYPRLEIVRQAKNDGARYFGPYPKAFELRETLHLINKHFYLRTCNDQVIDHRKQPCIQYQIGRCPAPCVQEINNYQDEVDNVICFLLGQTTLMEKRLQQQMWQAAQDENYEHAAKIRDQLTAIQSSMANQAVNKAGRYINEDIIATSRAGPLLEIVQIHVRQGRLLRTNHFSFDHQEFPTEELVLSFLTQLYEETETHQLPDYIFTSISLGANEAFLSSVLSERKNKIIHVKKPSRGKAKALIEIAQKNADTAIQDRLKNQERKTASLKALQDCLSLPFLPKTIECFDVSLFQGTDAVASQICFNNGEPNKSRYRKYNIKTVQGTDDFAMLYETLSRRLKRGLKDNDLPDLLLVDGGKGQLSVAMAACKDFGIPYNNQGHFYIAAIAKARTQSDKKPNSSVPIESTENFNEIKHSSERLFIPNVKDPILLKTHTAERYLIERIRDEAHRFAITAHRSKRKKRTLHSLLEKIPGIGKSRRQLLIKHLGSADHVMHASLENIAQIPGIGPSLAKQIYEYLKSLQ